VLDDRFSGSSARVGEGPDCGADFAREKQAKLAKGTVAGAPGVPVRTAALLFGNAEPKSTNGTNVLPNGSLRIPI
jgi:hypothetical protein